MSRSKKIKEEIACYSQIEHVHDLPPIYHYWADKFLVPKYHALGFNDPNDFYIQYIEKLAARHPQQTCRVFSIGAGNCDLEVSLTEELLTRGHDIRFTCMDINPHMLERGRRLAQERQLSSRFDFVETDVRDWQPGETYQVVLAHYSLHHIVELEDLFEKVHRALDDEGVFLTQDMIGRNGHMRWPEALEFFLALWATLEERHKFNHATGEYEPVYENYDSSREGFEGIRAQDILPLLIDRFHFDRFLAFNNLISVFVDRNFGPNFDPGDGRDRHFIEFVTRLDDYFIEVGKLKPTQMIAAMFKQPVSRQRVYKHLTPEFCLRPPGLDQQCFYITDPNPYAFKMGIIKKMRRRGFHKFLPKALRLKLKKLVTGGE